MIGAPGFAQIRGLAYDRDEKILYAVDTATDMLLRLDTRHGSGEADRGPRFRRRRRSRLRLHRPAPLRGRRRHRGRDRHRNGRRRGLRHGLRFRRSRVAGLRSGHRGCGKPVGREPKLRAARPHRSPERDGVRERHRSRRCVSFTRGPRLGHLPRRGLRKRCGPIQALHPRSQSGDREARSRRREGRRSKRSPGMRTPSDSSAATRSTTDCCSSTPSDPPS